MTFTKIYVIIREKMKGGTDYDQNDIDVGIDICSWFHRRPSNHKIYTICSREKGMVRNLIIGIDYNSELWSISVPFGRWSERGT